jgi:hypothetical protein
MEQARALMNIAYLCMNATAVCINKVHFNCKLRGISCNMYHVLNNNTAMGYLKITLKLQKITG